MLHTLPIAGLAAATPRAVLVRLDLLGAAFDYRPGQAVLVGARGQDVRRPYSLASAPDEARRSGVLELLIGVDGSLSPGPHLPVLTPGTLVEVEGPLGSFVLPERLEERGLLFIAGGTGIAPLRAMWHEALAQPNPPEIAIAYSARSPDEFAFARELQTLADGARVRLLQTVTREPGDWAGERGRLGVRHIRQLLTTTDTLCFACGPHALVKDVPRLLRQAGIDPSRIRIEDWGAAA